MDDYQEYPRWLYGANGAAIIVQDAEEHGAYADSAPGLSAPQWYFTPEEARDAFDEAPPAVIDPSSPARAELVARAEAVGLAVDNRWSLKNLKVKVLEAEEHANMKSDS